MKSAHSCIIAMILFPIMLSACALSPPFHDDLFKEQLFVVSVNPVAGSTVDSLPHIELNFSQPLLAASVTQEAVFIIAKDDYEQYDTEEWSDLYADVRNQEIPVVAGAVSLSQDGKNLNYVPLQALSENTEFLIVALPELRSTNYFPLNQTLAGGITSQFSSSFLIARQTTIQTTSDESPVENTDSTNPEPVGQGEPQSAAEEPESETEIAQSNDADEETEPQITFDWNRILITEVVTDPQQDHNETQGGNGVLFDSQVGSGTVGSTDEYLEIINGTLNVVDLSDWTVTMLDGSDVTQKTGEDWVTFFSLNGNVNSFLPGEFLVLGNPNGDLKNTITIALYDDTGILVDSVDIADGNANGIDDEAFQREEDGSWLLGPASPGSGLFWLEQTD